MPCSCFKSGGGGGGSGNTKDVIELTDGNFDEKVLQSGELWMVEFFAPWYVPNIFRAVGCTYI